MKKSFLYNAYIFVSIAAVFLSSPSLIINEISTLTGVNLSILNLAIFGNAGLLMVRHFRIVRMDRNSKRFATSYLVIIIYFVIIWVLEYEFNLSGAGPRGIIKTMVMVGFTLGLMNSVKFQIIQFLKFFVSVAAFFSLLSLILYFGYLAGFLTVSWSPVEGHFSMVKGFGGYLNTSLDFYQASSGISLRNQSYFTEPANLGQFLMVPLFIGSYIYGKEKNKVFFVLQVIIFLALFVTFSVANIFGLLFGLFVYYQYFLGSNSMGRNSAIRKALKFMMVIVILTGIYQLFNISNTTDRKTVFAKGENVALPERWERNVVYWEEVKDHPFGNIEFTSVNRSNPGMVGYLLIAGGFPLAVYFLVVLGTLVVRVARRSRKSEHALVFAGLFGFLPPFVWDGQFSEAYFLFLLALFVRMLQADRAGEFQEFANICEAKTGRS